MDGLLPNELKGVVAPLQFLTPMTEKPVAYNYEPPPGVPARTGSLEMRDVAVHDGRAVADKLSLDHEGFVLRRGPTKVTNFYDESQIVSIFYAECEETVKQATGANRAFAFDHIVRNEARAADKSSGVKMPSSRVHNDYTTASSPQRVRDLMGPQAAELLKQRYAIINLWRPIAGPLLKKPAGAVRRREPGGGEPRRQRTALPGPGRRDLFGDLQPEPALVLFPEDDRGRICADPLFRLGTLGAGAVFGAWRLHRPANPRERPAPREHRGADGGVLPAGMTGAPGFAENPDYRIAFEPSPRRVRVKFNGETIADSTDAHLLFETRHLPVYYFPRADVRMDLLAPTEHHTFCPYKGTASYWTIPVGERTSGERRVGLSRAVRRSRGDPGFRRVLLGPGRSLVRGGRGNLRPSPRPL